MALAMVAVATTASPFEARVLAARLGAEGFLWELRGNVDGPYPVGPVQVLVPEDDVDAVLELLLADEVEEVLSAASRDGAGRRSASDAWGAALIVAALAIFVVARVLTAV